MTSKTTATARLLAGVAVALMLAYPAAADLIAVSHLGYHPASHKQAIVYTDAGSGTFDIVDASSGTVVATYPLAKASDASGNRVECQGNTPCIVGDFSDFTRQGTYFIRTDGGESPRFSVSASVYADATPILLEFFNAMLQQGSAYHADWHRGYDPPFTSMSDGAIMMEADQAALTLARLGNAYRRNPELFTSDRYAISAQGVPDMLEYIHSYAEYLKGVQDHNGAPDVPRGWGYRFDCWPIVDLSQPMWDGELDPCMAFHEQTSSKYTTQALLAYLEALPALHAYDASVAQEYLDRAIRTYAHVQQAYGDVTGEDAAFLGAALFLLYDYTGEEQYLRAAHALRGSVPTQLNADNTHGNEFYWEEFVRHRDPITAAGLAYETNGQVPEELFRGKLFFDYKDRGGMSISANGERVYQFDNNIPFQNSRYMLLEGVMAAKTAEMSGEPFMRIIADSQLAWLTGMNALQPSLNSPERVSKSMIFGIGDFPEEFHVRYVDGSFFTDTSKTFLNGLRYIPGWINGAYDSPHDGDSVFNYHDDWREWHFTETTNEIVAAAIELIAHLDAQYNGRPRVTSLDGLQAGTAVPLPPPTSVDSGQATNSSGGATGSTGANSTGAADDPVDDAANGTETNSTENGSAGGVTNTTAPDNTSSDEQNSTGSGAAEGDAADGATNSTDGENQEDAGTDVTAQEETGNVSENAPETDGSLSVNETTAPPNATVGGDSPDEGSSGAGEGTGDARLLVMEWYPKGLHYVFVCETPGMQPTSYDWFFGDGEKLIEIRNRDVYHIYPEEGAYTVTCRGRADGAVQESTLEVQITREGSDTLI